MASDPSDSAQWPGKPAVAISLEARPAPVMVWTSPPNMLADLARWAGNPAIVYGYSPECRAFFYEARFGHVHPLLFEAAKNFFERDGSEALVFEWDEPSRCFRSRTLQYMKERIWTE